MEAQLQIGMRLNLGSSIDRIVKSITSEKITLVKANLSSAGRKRGKGNSGLFYYDNTPENQAYLLSKKVK